MNGAGLLIHDEFVAYFPALGRALGSVEDAVLVQALWFRRSRETGTTTATVAELAESVGMTERTARRRLAKLQESGVLSKGRASSYDATSVWSVDMVRLEQIRATTDVAKVATSRCHHGQVDVAKMAGSDVAKMASSDVARMASSSLCEELEELDKNVGDPADAGPRVEDRPEIHALCQRLADRIEGNGSKRPTITKRWLDAARLMVDRDGRTVDEIAGAIDWCQQDAFWMANILSMPKLREKFDQLRLQASRTAGGQRDRQGDLLRAEMERARRADAMDAGQHGPRAIEGEIW